MQGLPEINLVIAFTLGLFSTVHCLGMCGGIITAMSLGLPDDIRQDRVRNATLVSAYNIGRIVSYGIAGALAGAFGHLVFGPVAEQTGHYLLRGVAGAILILLGLHIAGWTTLLRHLEGAGLRLWQVIRPVGRYFLPVDNAYKALFMGCIWGWLPCGLVYSVLLWSAASVDPAAGMLYMICFGLGTLPGMISAGLLSSSLPNLINRARIRTVFALLIIGFGVISPWIHVSHQPSETSSPVQHQH